MKRLLLLIISLVLIATRGLCQNYSLTDCQQLFESGDKDEALPYLITMLELEKSKPDFDEDTVGTIFMLLTNIYSSHGQF